MKRPKHRKDYNNGKSGWVGGNPRYRANRNRKVPLALKGKGSTRK